MLKEQNILYQKLKTYIYVVNFNLSIIEQVAQSINKFVINNKILIEMTTEQRTFIDALIYRFLIIQDYSSNKLFPLIAQIITNQQQLSWFDTLALMEKHGIISSEQEWDKLRKLRNLLTHEYDDVPEIRANDINRLIQALPNLYKQIQLINNYVNKIL